MPLGFLIKATDYDGDSVLIGDNLTIKIRDDVPEATFDLSSASIIHDETSGADGDANDVNVDLSALFLDVSNKGNDPDVSNAFDPAIGYAAERRLHRQRDAELRRR